jgi:glutamyl-Q tRNA(Asp) synthetase
MWTRFAPSPTGHLHLGHLVNAIFVWGWARRAGGGVRLRIEDHDRERSRHEFEAGILDDLEWLGFVPDTPPIEAFRDRLCDGRQSDRPERYASAIATLQAQGMVYGCDCSRAELARRLGRPAANDEARYDGHCRTRGLSLDSDVGLRVRFDPGVETFDDLLLGLQQQDPSAQCGDVLVRDRVGQWTYQFAVTVDDIVDGITHVIRGRDLLASTGRQQRLARLLGRDEPARFLHHPLILGDDGAKLSKSRGDTGIRELRDAGLAPDDIIGRAAVAAGLLADFRPVAARDVAELVPASGGAILLP